MAYTLKKPPLLKCILNILPFNFIYSPLALYFKNAKLMNVMEIYGQRAQLYLPLQPDLFSH